jgi:hypothetical protein
VISSGRGYAPKAFETLKRDKKISPSAQRQTLREEHSRPTIFSLEERDNPHIKKSDCGSPFVAHLPTEVDTLYIESCCTLIVAERPGNVREYEEYKADPPLVAQVPRQGDAFLK